MQHHFPQFSKNVIRYNLMFCDLIWMWFESGVKPPWTFERQTRNPDGLYFWDTEHRTKPMPEGSRSRSLPVSTPGRQLPASFHIDSQRWTVWIKVTESELPKAIKPIKNTRKLAINSKSHSRCTSVPNKAFSLRTRRRRGIIHTGNTGIKQDAG